MKPKPRRARHQLPLHLSSKHLGGITPTQRVIAIRALVAILLEAASRTEEVSDERFE
jgi:hypothetical protein